MNEAYDTHESFYESRARNFRKKSCTCNLWKFYMTHLLVEQQKLQVKSGVASWLYCIVNVDLTSQQQ